MSEISISHKSVQLSLIIKKLSIASVVVTPYTSANIYVTLYYDEVATTIVSPSDNCKSLTVFMPTEDYLKWQNDDSYLIDFVLAKLQLVKE